MQRPGLARRAAAANPSLIKRAVDSTLEQLEGRQLFAIAINSGLDSDGNKYFAWEAETRSRSSP